MTRRMHVPFIEFDQRSSGLEDRPDDTWTPERKERYKDDFEKLQQRLSKEFGTYNIYYKTINFIDIGGLPLSIKSHHNKYIRDSRDAFTYGSFYSSLTASCSLGERILNRMILDLKKYYDITSSPIEIRRGRPISNWQVMVDELLKWDCIKDETAKMFINLKKLRNRSIHFNASTDSTFRRDAISAFSLLRGIIDIQFSCFSPNCPWIIFDGFRYMVKKDYEDHPFVKAYYRKVCPYLTFRYKYDTWNEDTWVVTDKKSNENTDMTDDEYILAREHYSRETFKVDYPIVGDGFISFAWALDRYWAIINQESTPDGERLVLADPYYNIPEDAHKKASISLISRR